MSSALEAQTIALAGVFQSAVLVDQLATTARASDSAFAASLNSLFIRNPDSTLDVFGDLYGVRMGLQQLARVFSPNQSQYAYANVIRYSLSLLQLEAKLRRRHDMLDVIGSRIDQAAQQAAHFEPAHPNVINNLADLYRDTISTFAQRIQVTGEPSHLQVELNAAKIRTLLLAGIRSAMLWRQLGGRRWHLLFKRKRIVEHCQRLLDGLPT